jgi:hypothetical protein
MSDESLRALTALIEGGSKGKEDVPQGLADLLKASSERSLNLPPNEIATILVRRLEMFRIEHQFNVGQVVRWKEGLRNKRLPRVGEPAIVVEVLEAPIRADSDAGSAYFCEPLDIVLGVLDPDGDFVTFYFDKRRFEPYREE